MEYQITIEHNALKALEKISRNERNRIVKAIESLSNNPRPAGTKKAYWTRSLAITC